VIAMGILKDEKGAVDTPFLVIGFMVAALVVVAFFVRHGAMVTEYPGERIAEQVSYGQASDVDVREILDKAYARAVVEAGVNGTDSQVDVDSRFSYYAELWLRDYFEQRGIHNVSLNISSRSVPMGDEEFSGSVSEVKYGDYTVTYLL